MRRWIPRFTASWGTSSFCWSSTLKVRPPPGVNPSPSAIPGQGSCESAEKYEVYVCKVLYCNALLVSVLFSS